jgi:outer membrane protein TolC
LFESDQALAAYLNTILIAYGEVDDALTDLHALSDEVGTLRNGVSPSKRRNWHRMTRDGA